MIVQYVKLTIIGLVSGLLAGVVGGGSDAVIVPALVGMGVLGSYKTAVGTSLATLLPPVGIFAVWNYYKKGDVKIWYAMYLAVMFTVGSYLMSKVGIKINKGITRKVYGIFLIVLGIFILFDKSYKKDKS